MSNPESLSTQLELIAISRGASGLSGWQKDTILKAAKKLRRLDADTEKELAKVKEELLAANKELEEYRSEFQ